MQPINQAFPDDTHAIDQSEAARFAAGSRVPYPMTLPASLNDSWAQARTSYTSSEKTAFVAMPCLVAVAFLCAMMEPAVNVLARAAPSWVHSWGFNAAMGGACLLLVACILTGRWIALATLATTWAIAAGGAYLAGEALVLRSTGLRQMIFSLLVALPFMLSVGSVAEALSSHAKRGSQRPLR